MFQKVEKHHLNYNILAEIFLFPIYEKVVKHRLNYNILCKLLTLKGLTERMYKFFFNFKNVF